MKIIGFFKCWRLVERNGEYFVVNRETREVLFKGTEDQCSKKFIMLAAGFIEERA